LATTTLAAAMPALAQTAPATEAVAIRDFNIQVPSLSDALTLFGRQAGLQVSVDAAAIRGLPAPTVTGTMTADQALGRLLAGSGFGYRIAGGNVVTLKLPAGGTNTVQLGPVQVEGQSPATVLASARATEDPAGPGLGYVASRSAAGTKTNASLIETPQTINVITRDQMDAQGIQSVPQALRYTPGVEAELSGVDNRIETNQITIRGFTPDEYLDGLRLQTGTWANPQIDPSGLDRIEVLKGPSSVLYGQASPGGILDLSSKTPTTDPVHEVTLEGGSYGQIGGSFDLGGPIDGDDRYLYRVTGIARDADTQVDHTKLERFSISPSFTWRPTDSDSLTFLANYQNDPDAGFFNQLPTAGTLTPLANGAKIPTNFYSGEPDFDKYTRTQGSVGSMYEHRFDDVWSVRQNFRYMHVDADFATTYPTALASDGISIKRANFTELEHLDTVALDNQAQANFDTAVLHHTVVFGIDYQHSVGDAAATSGTAPSIDPFAPIYGVSVVQGPVTTSTLQTQDQVGLYAQDQIKFGRWNLLLGGRQDWAASEADNRLKNTSTDVSSDAFTWRAGLNYVFDMGIAPYASYSKSFQPSSGVDFSGNQFKPTTGEEYETGIKYQPTGINSFITASLFDLTQQNVLTTDPDPTHVGFSVQTGEIRVRGAELEGKASLSDGLDLTASFTDLDPDTTKSNSGTEGKQPVSIPNQTASFWANYTVQGGSLEDVGIGGGVRWISSAYANTANTAKTPAYTLFDLAFHYDLGNFSPTLTGTQLGVNATNLFDKTYIAHCSNVGCGYGLRRAVYASVSYKW
jgi:iron complex outermembrane recepter protein